MHNTPILNVVVYRDPGPSDEEIDRHSAQFVKRKSIVPLGGDLGYLTLVPDDFDRVWEGLNAGDALGTAFSVLQFLGPRARRLIDRTDDFIYGWIGDDKTDQGRMLLLQVIPREPSSGHTPSLN